MVQRKIDTWTLCPPDYPIILAGSTGSRGTTQMLMQAVAALPQGAVVLPGYDFDTPDAVWSAMGDAMLSEDHPQYRFQRAAVCPRPWRRAPMDAAEPASPERARLVSLALRPAPITDQWLDEGPSLTGIGRAMEDVTLIEAPSHRIEALSIAMRLREAAETGQTAALITPDRGLTRRGGRSAGPLGHHPR